MKIMDTTTKRNKDDGTFDWKNLATTLYNMFVELTTPFMRMMISCVIGLIAVTRLNLFAFWPFSIVTNLLSEFITFIGVLIGTVSVLWVITMNFGSSGTTTTTINNKKSVSPKKHRDGSISPTKKRKLTGMTGNVPKMMMPMMDDVPQLYDCPLDTPSTLSTLSMSTNTFNMHQQETVVVNTTKTPTPTKKKKKYTSAQMKAMREIARKARDDGLLGR